MESCVTPYLGGALGCVSLAQPRETKAAPRAASAETSTLGTAITVIKGALSSIYRAAFPEQMCLNVPFGMRNPAAPRSLAGSQAGIP